MKNMKDDLISKLKRKISEPKIFSLLISSMRGQIMYMGIHFSLEEAYAAARKKLEEFSPISNGEAVDLDMWNAIPARQIISQMIDPDFVEGIFGKRDDVPNPIEMLHPDVNIDKKDITEMTLADVEEAKKILHFNEIVKDKTPSSIDDNLRDIRKSKNELMKSLILSGKIELVDKVKGVLGASSAKYVKNKIEENKIIRKDDF